MTLYQKAFFIQFLEFAIIKKKGHRKLCPFKRCLQLAHLVSGTIALYISRPPRFKSLKSGALPDVH